MARRSDPLRLAQAKLSGARRRLADLDNPAWASRFRPDELEREKAETRASIEQEVAKIRQLGGDPDEVA